MTDDQRFYVTEAPRQPVGRLFHAASVAACMQFVRSRSGPGAPRMAVWAATPPPDDGPDAFLCVPVGVAEGWRGAAAEIVQGWDDAWLLVESAPRAHREEAREALVDALAAALASAAASGFDDNMDLAF